MQAGKIPELRAVSECTPPLSDATRQACAGRLLSLLEAAGRRAAAPPAKAASGAVVDAGAGPGEDAAAKTRRARDAALAEVAGFVSSAAEMKV